MRELSYSEVAEYIMEAKLQDSYMQKVRRFVMNGSSRSKL